MNDYDIRFKFGNGNPNPEWMIDQLIEIVERVDSWLGGGCDRRGGGFFVETGERFQLTNLLLMVGVLLPEAKSLTIKAVAKEKPRTRRVPLTRSAKRRRRPTRRKG